MFAITLTVALVLVLARMRKGAPRLGTALLTLFFLVCLGIGHALQ